ncbi:hypothetical protein D9615_004793 [Tricholomella constricta]|uniref:Uncharacterized protein n=1 Tax=Tricholomella constricta TaxID=117010 RepID=A0A8H5M6H6_9AGAR|nr:hypothetical protein D9615_004793 [Tricholomella constricta]
MRRKNSISRPQAYPLCSMVEALNQDVFSQILSFVYERETLYTIIHSIPLYHPLLDITLRRLCQLPMPLSCKGLETKDQVFELLVLSSKPFLLADAIRHLVVETSRYSGQPGDAALRQHLTDLFQKTRNLQVLDWSGAGPSTKDLGVLRGLHNLKTLRVDCHGPMTRPRWEPSWDIAQFVSTLGPNLTHLELRKINLEMYNSLLAHKSSFTSYHSLEHLALDLIEVTWDLDGPIPGATETIVFTNLGFPAVKELELKMDDLLIAAERVGPMALIDWEPLKTLRIFVNPYRSKKCLYNMRFFMALPPDKFSSLATLEIRDKIQYESRWRWPDEEADPDYEPWDDSSRTYWGLVPHFLSSVRSGSLPNLVNLWVNENALSMPKNAPQEGIFSEGAEFYSVDELWAVEDGDEEENARKAEWISILRAVFVRLESLRVGFGPLSAREVGRVLECCSSDKLTQFGFQYSWQVIERDWTISPALLEQLRLFPKLTSVHLLQPRPRTQDVYRLPWRTMNGRTLDDISAIFKSNPNICHVGVGQNAVWERRCFPPALHLDTGDIILTQNAFLHIRLRKNEEVPRFFDIGELAEYGEFAYRPRQVLADDVRELRNVLRRFFVAAVILTASATHLPPSLPIDPDARD